MSTNTNTNFVNVLDAVAQNGGVQPSMRALAEVFNITTNALYTRGKKAIPGQIYDPEATNWDAISEYLNGKMPEGEDMVSMIAKANEKDEWYKENAPSRARSSAGATLIEVDGEMIAPRKSSMFEMGGEQESLLCFKHDATVYKMVYQTMSFTVVRPVNEDGSFASNDLRVLSNATINTKCVPPMTLAAAIAERFSGEYAAKLAAEEAAKKEKEQEPELEGQIEIAE